MPHFFTYLLSVSTNNGPHSSVLWFRTKGSLNFMSLGFHFFPCCCWVNSQRRMRKWWLYATICNQKSHIFFCLWFFFSHFEHDVPRYRFFGVYPSLCSLSFLDLFCFVFLINLFIYFIYFWLRWVFVAACGLSLVVVSGGCSSLWCAGFSLRWLLLLRSTGSRCAGFSSCCLQALEHRLSSCGARA